MSEWVEGYLDRFFARRLLKDGYDEEKGLFLSRLMEVSRQGHLCWKTAEAPSLPDSILSEGKELFSKTPVVRLNDCFYLQKNWVYETYVLQEVKRLCSLRPPEHLSAPLDPTLLPQQQRALETAFQRTFSLICGGPGTGKTYTAAAIARHLANSSPKKRDYRIALAAPTGKAASHLQTALGSVEARIEATTLHRLLRMTPGEVRLFLQHKLDVDLVIVDEASMMDVPLLAHLFEAIGEKTRVVMMGDPDQLPPVEAGSLFAEMASLFGVKLQKVMRTEDVALQALAEGINQGDIKGRCVPLELSQLYDRVDPMLCWDEPDPVACLKKLNQFRVLCALRQGPLGIEALNQQIMQEIHRRIRPGQWWVVPIMITWNEPKLELYNGTCGVLIGKSRGGIQLRESTAYFPHPLPCSRLPSFEIAFCLSIHKSQGSEFDHVLALFPPGSENFGREALYTAVTRAKKGVEIMGDEALLQAMVARKCQKMSGFTERFKSF